MTRRTFARFRLSDRRTRRRHDRIISGIKVALPLIFDAVSNDRHRLNCYSVLRAVVGSTHAARRAGGRPATIETAMRTSVVAASVAGSRGDKLKRNCATMVVAAAVAASP